MFMYPVNTDASLPKEFIQYAQTATWPATLDPAMIAANRDNWIADWTAVVFH
jgi:thiamine transport system substrate-binding protein